MASLASTHLTQPQSATAAASAAPAFTPLERSIIRLARSDSLWTARQPGRLRRLWNGLLGRCNPMLANPRLEALRRMAVLAWHHGHQASPPSVRDFLAAGFTEGQYELLLSSVEAARPGGKDGRP